MNRTKWLMSLFMAASLMAANSSQAQEVKGTTYVNVGIGIGTFGFTGTGGVPLVASVEHGVTDKISAGVYGGMIKRKFGTDVKYSYVVFGSQGRLPLQ